MRTKLDEIVDEEFPELMAAHDRHELEGLGRNASKVMRIAEKAFRHGVERVLAEIRCDMVVPREQNVQPAPTDEKASWPPGWEEEKCCWCGQPPHDYALGGHRYAPCDPGMTEAAKFWMRQCSPFKEKCGCTPKEWCDMHRPRRKPRCPNGTHSDPCGCWPDRRKGHRRLGGEFIRKTKFMTDFYYDCFGVAPVKSRDRRSGDERRKP